MEVRPEPGGERNEGEGQGARVLAYRNWNRLGATEDNIFPFQRLQGAVELTGEISIRHSQGSEMTEAEV